VDMHKQDVLIPSAGGAAGVGAIKSLRMCKFRGKIVSTDADALSAGLYLADNGYVVPPANDSSFFQEAMKIIEKEQLNIILPTSGFDIVPYSKNKKVLESVGVTPAMSDYETIETCLNKAIFFYRLKNKFNLPYTTTNPYKIDTFPCIAKPIFGKGSKNVFICNDETELNIILSKYNDMIIQEYLLGKEYTIDVLSDLDSNALLAIPRERIEVKAGISFKGKIILDETIQEECLNIAEYIGIKGPSCMQMKCDREGTPKMTEVNPRMGGGTIMTTYAGVNFPELIIKMVNNEKIKIPEIKEITMVRYYEEVILNEKGKVMRIATRKTKSEV
jgi:carbamoyl-phosphate synthase large subunit